MKNEGGRKDSLHGQATCNSRVGPLMSSEKDFVGGGANRSYYHPLRGIVNLENIVKKVKNYYCFCHVHSTVFDVHIKGFSGGKGEGATSTL